MMFRALSMINEKLDTDGTGYLLTEDVIFFPTCYFSLKASSDHLTASKRSTN